MSVEGVQCISGGDTVCQWMGYSVSVEGIQCASGGDTVCHWRGYSVSWWPDTVAVA